MKKIILVIALLLSATFFVSNQSYAQSDWTGNINFVMGSKSLDEDDWKPLEAQAEFGVNFDFGSKSWPIRFDIGYLKSSDEVDIYDSFYDITLNSEASTSELRLGVKKIWEPTLTMRPYVSGGLAMINAKIKTSALGFSDSEDDSAVGLYVNGGIYWTVASSFNLGFELGYSKAKVTIYGYDAEAGGGHALLLAGYHF
jgi:opacity protein-like surface antigen